MQAAAAVAAAAGDQAADVPQLQRLEDLHPGAGQAAGQALQAVRVVVPGRAAGPEQHDAASAGQGGLGELGGEGVEGCVVAKVGAELYGEVAAGKALADSGDLAPGGVGGDGGAEAFGRQHRRVGDQVGRDACRVEVGEGLALTHADGISLAERLDHLGAQCWRAVRQVGAPDADVEQLRPREQPPPRHIGCQAGEAEGVAGPGQALGRVGVEAGDEGWHRVGRLQHQRGVPGFAGEDLAAHVDEAHGGVAELGGEPGEGVGAVAAEGAQVAFGEAGEDQPATGQQGGGEVGEQQVAEVVPVEGAQQDGRGVHRARDGSVMAGPESMNSP